MSALMTKHSAALPLLVSHLQKLAIALADRTEGRRPAAILVKAAARLPSTGSLDMALRQSGVSEDVATVLAAQIVGGCWQKYAACRQKAAVGAFPQASSGKTNPSGLNTLKPQQMNPYTPRNLGGRVSGIGLAMANPVTQTSTVVQPQPMKQAGVNRGIAALGPKVANLQQNFVLGHPLQGMMPYGGGGGGGGGGAMPPSREEPERQEKSNPWLSQLGWGLGGAGLGAAGLYALAKYMGQSPDAAAPAVEPPPAPSPSSAGTALRHHGQATVTPAMLAAVSGSTGAAHAVNTPPTPAFRYPELTAEFLKRRARGMRPPEPKVDPVTGTLLQVGRNLGLTAADPSPVKGHRTRVTSKPMWDKKPPDPQRMF